MTPQLASNEFAISLADNTTYVINLDDTTSTFHLKALNGSSLQTSVDNAAELYGAARAINLLRTWNSGAIAQTITAWNDSLTQIGTILTDKGILGVLQTTASAAIVSFTGEAGAVSLVAIDGLKDAVSSLATPVAELAFAYKLISDAETGLSQLTSQYQGLLSPGPSQPVSLTTVSNLVNNTLSALSLGAAALKIADSIPGVLNGSIWDDIFDFGKGIADQVAAAFIETPGLSASEVSVFQDAQDLNDFESFIADIPDWVTNASAIIDYVDGTNAGSYFPLLSINGLNQTANGPLKLSPAIAPGQIHTPSGGFISGYSITPSSQSVSESKGVLRFTIQRTNTTAAETLLISTVQDLGATNPGENYYYQGLRNQAVQFAAGVSTATVDLTINDVHLTTGTESFHIIAQDSTGTNTLASDVFTIVNDDPVPATTYSISVGSQPFSEHQGTATITITRSGGNVGKTETLYLSTVHDQGTGNPNGSYFYNGLLDQPVTFNGNATSVTVQLTINDLGLTSGSETFRLILEANALGGVGSPLASTNFTITNSPSSVLPSGGATISALVDPVVLRVGNQVIIDAHKLNAYEQGQIDSQLQYTIISGPSYGSIRKQGAPTSSFTQTDIGNGLISYFEDGTNASSDSFIYRVIDSHGGKTTDTTFNIQILPAATGAPSVDTNATLAVATNGSGVISASNLHVTDAGVNSYQIIYTLISGPSSGKITADGSQSVTWFTQQEVDLGLISYVNTSGSAGTDTFVFTMSDGVGGAIGQTTFDINVIAPNNLHLINNNVLTTNPNGAITPPGGSRVPGRDSIITSTVLSVSDPGVSPQNITYHIVSQAQNDLILVGSWGAFDGSDPVAFTGNQYSASDAVRGSFTQDDINSGRVFYQSFTGGSSNGQSTSLVLSASDSVDNTIQTIIVPVSYITQQQIIYNGVAHSFDESGAANITASIGGMTTIGSGVLSQVWQPLLPSQIKYSLWFAPQHGSVLLNGVPLVPYVQGTQQTSHNTFSQDDIDQGRITYIENGDAVPADEFGIFKYNLNETTVGGAILFNVGLTGKNGGVVDQGTSGSELLSSGLGNNYFFGDGAGTTVSYAFAPSRVVVDLAQGTAQNGFGGTDTLVGITSVTGSAHDDIITVSNAGDVLDGGLGHDIAVFNSTRAQTTLTRDQDGSWTAVGPDGIDTLRNIETARFSDGDVQLAPIAGDFDGKGKSDILWRNLDGSVAEWQMSGSTIAVNGVLASNPGPGWKIAGVGDFNGDGLSDILWRNADGRIAEWQMNGTTISVNSVLGTNPGTSWKVAGVGDFNADGHADVLFRNDDGTIAIWEMNGTTITSNVVVSNPGVSWKVAGVGDFNGDGYADVLFRNDDGRVAEWQMNGTTIVSNQVLGTNPGPSWSVAGVGDFNGDGLSDILWRNVDGSIAEWQMNGTTIVSNQVLGNPGPSWSVAGVGDYDGDGKSDILFRNSDGRVAEWQMNGTTILSEPVLSSNPGTSWRPDTSLGFPKPASSLVLGGLDFNGDGLSDIVWRNDDGTIAEWQMSGTTAQVNTVLSNPGTTWSLAGEGDFNGDGLSDILFRNSSTGAIAEWQMSGTTVETNAVINSNPGTAWNVAGEGDFNGDGISDILFRNSDGRVAEWQMNGTTIQTNAVLSSTPDTSWQVAGVGDFNGDGLSDILWQNSTTGAVAEWQMNGTTIENNVVLGTNPGTSWSVAGVGDFNGDGQSDILFRNTDGSVAMWLMNGTNIVSNVVLGNPGTQWQVAGVGDYNGDGLSDILWRNSSTGSLAEWQMNGTIIQANLNIPTNPGTTWHPV